MKFNENVYTCPMHPEIQQDHSGFCPICGMELELKLSHHGRSMEMGRSAELELSHHVNWEGPWNWELSRTIPTY